MVLLGLLAAPQLRASAPAMQMGPGGRTYSGLGRIPRPVPSGSNGGRGRWGEYSGQAYRASRNSDLRRARRGEFGGPRGGPPFFGPEAYGPYGMPPPFGGGPYPAPGPYPWGGAFPTDAEYQGGPYPARVEGQPANASHVGPGPVHAVCADTSETCLRLGACVARLDSGGGSGGGEAESGGGQGGGGGGRGGGPEGGARGGCGGGGGGGGGGGCQGKGGGGGSAAPAGGGGEAAGLLNYC
uniref:Uncharacterized protein n=1 Tax=Emiliania huxleyi TaxID=2903 RepID=A0A7S3RVU4_EMIHU